MLTLYYMPGACSLSPHIVAHEAGIPLTLQKVSKDKKLPDGADFFAVNSKGLVPVLQLEDGRTLTEGPAIVQYLADLKPEAQLAPPNGTWERYQLQSWLNFITSELHKQFAPLFSPTSTEDVKATFRAVLSDRFDWLAPQLTERPFLMGDQFSIADAYLFNVLRWTPFVGVDLSRWPSLAAYVARMGERPSVQAAMQAEGIRR
jgi:glutathione S-transferase